MSPSLVISIVALVFLIVSCVLAIVQNQIAAPQLWALWSIAVIVIFSVFPGKAR